MGKDAENSLERSCKNCERATSYVPPYEDEFAYDILSNRGRHLLRMCDALGSPHYGQRGVSSEAKNCEFYKPQK